jgi:hypothetical protein
MKPRFHYATADFAAGAAVWFICLVSMVLILTPASNRYFVPRLRHWPVRPGEHTRFSMRNMSSMA